MSINKILASDVDRRLAANSAIRLNAASIASVALRDLEELGPATDRLAQGDKEKGANANAEPAGKY